MNNASTVSKLYQTVVDDVIMNIKESFLDEGVDEQVIQELKQLWEGKLASPKALEQPTPSDHGVSSSQNMVVTLPQPLYTLPSQQPGVHGQLDHIQATTQYQLSSAAASGALALPPGLIHHHHLAALGPRGQIQNITVQQTGTGQFIALTGVPPQQLPQSGNHLAAPMLHQTQVPKQVRFPQQQPKMIHADQLLQQNSAALMQQGIHHNLIQMDGVADTSSSDDDFDEDDDKEEEDKEEDNEEEGQREEEINRNKNKWKFHLKDGIMNLNGRDFVFQKATGDSEW